MRVRGPVVVAVALAAVLLVVLSAPPALAGSVDADGTSIIAFSDLHQSPSASLAQADLSLLSFTYCKGKGDRGPKLSLKAALRVARRLVSEDSRGRGLRSFSHSSDGRTEKRSLAAAAGALGAGRPAAALAALLRAHQLASHDPVPLIDAAPLLTEASQGRAALSLLGAAARLRAPRTHPFGISWRALANDNRGQALLATHQYGPAAKALRAAVKSAPLLQEAEQNLTVAYDCSGKKARATQMLFLAVRRQRFAQSDYVDKSSTDPGGQLRDPAGLDTSRGAKLTLPTLKYPQTMGEGVREHDAFVQIELNLVNNEESLNKQQGADESALFARLRKRSPLTLRRTQDIMAAQGDAYAQPDLDKLYRQSTQLAADMGQLQLQGENQAGCADPGLHSQWLQDMKAYDTVTRKLATGVYRFEVGIATNLKDPLAHKVALENARLVALGNFDLIEGQGVFLTSYDEVCDSNPPSGSENPESGKMQTPGGPACPTGIEGPGFTINLLVFALSVDCEEVKGRVTVGEGWLNGFVSVSHNFTSGSTTIFAGPQVGANVEFGPFKGGVTGRGGVYVTVGSDGSLQDVGVRAESSAGVKISDVGDSLSGPKASISFAGAFAPST